MTRCAFISIVGRPNVGKSTLLNALVGEHVAIVSPKPQTTRAKVTGILTKGEDQFIFVDTPGMHRPRTKLGEYMKGQIREGMSGADAAVLVSEPQGEVRPAEEELMERLWRSGTPVVLVLNKVDTLPDKGILLQKIAAFSGLGDFARVVPVSARSGDGVDILLRELSAFAREGPHYFGDDAYTEQPERVLAAELLREQLLRALRDEVPHGAAVVVERMCERPEGDIVDIDAVIYCEKDTHKGIIIGKKGGTLKAAAGRARESMERLLQAKVNLRCWVKVRKDWRNREGSLRELGFR